jgi:histidinol-phosphatase (PHP family)
MEYLISKDIPFEINCGAYNRGRKAELYPNRFLLKKLQEFGGEILINSDAHQKELLDGGFDHAVRTAIDCGFTHTNFLEHGPDGKIVFRQVPLDGELFS